MAISASKRTFITRSGARVAELRKAQSITQVQMAEALRLSTLPQSQQRLVMQLLDGVIAQAGR